MPTTLFDKTSQQDKLLSDRGTKHRSIKATSSTVKTLIKQTQKINKDIGVKTLVIVVKTH